MECRVFLSTTDRSGKEKEKNNTMMNGKPVGRVRDIYSET